MKPIFLYGPSGTGKTTIGKVLARNLRRSYIDLDDWIEKYMGETIAQIFERVGESGFRRIEREALFDVLKSSPGVVALGGGALIDQHSRQEVEFIGAVICLTAEIPTLLARIKQTPAIRPLIPGEQETELVRLLQTRQSHYQSFNYVLDTTHLSPEEAAWEIQIEVGIFHLSAFDIGCDLIIGSDAFDELAFNAETISPTSPIFVTDENVARFLMSKLQTCLGKKFETFVLPPGESTKSLAQLQKIWNSLLRHRYDRSSLLYAFGGGVIGDLTGFAAATYMRGIPWINVPTTLLSQVDASIGAKTGINLDQGKNLIGAFHQPLRIITDPSTLKSLPEREFMNGMAEVIKHGLIGDPELFKLCAQGPEYIHANLNKIVSKAAAVKVKVVEQDPKEGQLRKVLNFGHTIGHAIERASEYRLKHGEAVAIGMHSEAYLAEKIGLAEDPVSEPLVEILNLFSLPHIIPRDISVSNILDTMAYDKKRKQGQVLFALPSKLGCVHPEILVDNLELLLSEFATGQK